MPGQRNPHKRPVFLWMDVELVQALDEKLDRDPKYKDRTQMVERWFRDYVGGRFAADDWRPRGASTTGHGDDDADAPAGVAALRRLKDAHEPPEGFEYPTDTSDVLRHLATEGQPLRLYLDKRWVPAGVDASVDEPAHRRRTARVQVVAGELGDVYEAPIGRIAVPVRRATKKKAAPAVELETTEPAPEPTEGAKRRAKRWDTPTDDTVACPHPEECGGYRADSAAALTEHLDLAHGGGA